MNAQDGTPKIFGPVSAVLIVILSTASVTALCPSPTPKVCSEFFESDAVFVGTVLSQRYVDDSKNIRFELRVSQVVRGTVGRRVSVYSGNDSGLVDWKLGKTYVVFARREKDRLLSYGDCGPLTDPTRVSQTLREISALRGATRSSIEGEFVGRMGSVDGVNGVVVHAAGAGRTFETKSDSRGQFRMELPPGRYTVTTDPKFRKSAYNLWEPLTVRLVAGQCAQYQFEPRQ